MSHTPHNSIDTSRNMTFPMPSDGDGIDMLFLCDRAMWPLDQGCRIHGYQTAAAAARLGASVKIACSEPTPSHAPEGMHRMLVDWPRASEDDRAEFRRGWQGSKIGTWVRHRVAEHQGLNLDHLAGAVTLVRRLRPRVVVGVGMHAALMLHGLAKIPNVTTVWYAADELVYFNLSCMLRDRWADIPWRLKTLRLHAAIERSFGPGLDAAIGVSPLDTRLLRHVAGVRRTVTIRNGVDLDFFSARDTPPPRPRSLAFWGRMDFEPNIDGACWFAGTVWPRLRQGHPDARLTIAGKNPDPRVLALRTIPGVTVLADVPDIRTVAHAAAVTVLPMRCGGGIKNKLLEAAAMARPIVASPRAVEGLQPDGSLPMRVCRRPKDWVESIEGLWSSPTAAASLGRMARQWAEQHHSWDAAAATLLAWLNETLGTACATRAVKVPINNDDASAARRAA